jgi:branched-subunit amino acid ABC-type transport system permease component
MALAGYLAYTLFPYVGFWGALIIGPCLAGVVGYAVEQLIVKRLYLRDPLYSLLATFGLALIMQDLLRTIWGAQGLPLAIPGFLNQPVSNVYFFVTGYRLLVVALAIISTGSLFAVLRYTRLGVRIRAGNADLETIAALGVNIYLLRSANFVLGIMFAGLAGILADHAGLRGHRRRRRRLSAGLSARRADHRRRRRDHHRVPAGGERGGDLCDHGADADRATARVVWPGRAVRMSQEGLFE